VGDFEAEISVAPAGGEAVSPAAFTVDHHIVDRAEVRAASLSGGHLMHLAVAGCLFNDVLRAARARGIEVDELRVSADGGFEGDPLASTGITYEVDLAADAPDEVLRALVAECEAKAAIPYMLREGTSVEASSVTIKGAR
jgi:uncharacterized OsmC-like protein